MQNSTIRVNRTLTLRGKNAVVVTPETVLNRYIPPSIVRRTDQYATPGR